MLSMEFMSIEDINSILDEVKKYKKLSKYQKDFFASNPNIEWPLCECGCGEKVLLNISDSNTVFRRFASVQCSRKSKTIPKDALDKLSNKEWLYNERIKLKKSKELIAKELGISTSPVYKWCKLHNITNRLNCSSQEILSKLEDKNFMIQKYIIEKMKCEDIAKELKTTKSTVSIYLSKHGIETRNPNSYDRPFTKISSGHQELIEYIKEIYHGKILINHRNLLDGIELDIYLPEKKLAIEFNGVYWHIINTIKMGTDGKNYHKKKLNLCREKGVHLLQIWSSQWETKKDIVKSIISIKLNDKSLKRIYARKCKIVELSAYDKNTFLESNHLMGKDKSNYKYGLVYNDEIVSVMTYRNSRYNKKYDYELSRFSVKCNTIVIGGFSKLLKHFRKMYSGSIISYADLMYSEGNVYKKNGFELLHETKPKYWYVKEGTEILEHRAMHMKKEKNNKTENQIMIENGYNKIWDCGVLSFGLK